MTLEFSDLISSAKFAQLALHPDHPRAFTRTRGESGSDTVLRVKLISKEIGVERHAGFDNERVGVKSPISPSPPWRSTGGHADRKFNRGFGAMVREVIFCTEAGSVTAEDILHQTIANLCIQPP